MTNTLPFLPIELQNIIIAYTRPVYPYIRQLKNKIKIFELKNEEYKLEYEEESGLTFNNYYFCMLEKGSTTTLNYKKNVVCRPNYNICLEKGSTTNDIEDMGCNFMDSVYYLHLEDCGMIINYDDDPEKCFLDFFFYMILDNRRRYINFREFERNYSGDSDSDSDY